MEAENSSDILYVGFNQNADCFAWGTENGFKIYNTDPFRNTFSRDLEGGIGLIAMLFRWNILAITGGGSNPRYSPDRVMLWDDSQAKCIGELKFKSEVKGIKMNKETIVVILEDRIYVYEFMNLKISDAIETWTNPDGICCLSSQKDTNVLVCPDKEQGSIKINNNDASHTVKAHDGSIVALALSPDSKRWATASEKGTLIRIFDTSTGSKIQEVRRGADPAKIYSIAFSSNDLLAVSSDKGTVHIFALKKSESEEAETSKNTTSYFGFMKGVLPEYFSSEWSFAQFKFNEDSEAIHTAWAFTDNNSLVLVSKKGDYYLLEVDRDEKTVTKKAHLMVNSE